MSLIAEYQQTKDKVRFQEFSISVKAQKFSLKFEDTKRDIFKSKIRDLYADLYLKNESNKALQIDTS